MGGLFGDEDDGYWVLNIIVYLNEV
jgi:hypothetical protein